MTADTDDVGAKPDRPISDGSRGLDLTEVLDLHLRFPQHPSDRYSAVLVLVYAHDGERDQLTRHVALQRLDPAMGDRICREAFRAPSAWSLRSLPLSLTHRGL